MRKSIASLLIALSIIVGLPVVGSAQAGKTGTLFGQIVDVSGRGSAGRTVELVSDGMIVGMTTSSYDGHFTFAVSGSGNYVVRTLVNGHPAGVRISVVRGQNPPMALLVLPTVATSSAQLGAALSGAVSTLTSLGTVVVSTAASQLVTSISEKKDDEILADPETKQEVFALITQIVQQLNPGSTFVAGPNTPVPPGLGLPPDLVAAINDIVTNTPTGSTSGH